MKYSDNLTGNTNNNNGVFLIIMKTKNAQDIAITCIVGEKTEITGDINAKEPIRIEGMLTGNIVTDSLVVIGSSSIIKGNITAENLCIGGKITGDITVTGKIEALSSASITGNISASTIVIDENAFFEGNCHMTKQIEA